MSRYCDKCDKEMEMTYEVDWSNIEYAVWECPKCGFKIDETGEPDADLMFEQMREDRI